MLAFLGLAVVHIAANVTAESDHKAARKVPCYSLTGSRRIYDYQIGDVHNKHPINWSQYLGKVVLLVNVASF